MANFKRRRSRIHSGRPAIRGSTASWRAKHGFKPARLDNRKDYTAAEWKAAWQLSPSSNRSGKVSGYLSMMGSYPAWWDRLFHTRPARSKNRATLRRVLIGTTDPDDAFWHDGRKPHIYYW